MALFINYRNACIITCIAVLSGCGLLDKKDEEFRFNPARHKEYNYSLTIASSYLTRHLPGDTAPPEAVREFYDTVLFGFALKNIYYADSIIICKLTFNDLKVKRPPFRITIKNNSFSGQMPMRNPFSILDSIGYFIHGRSIQVVINKKGEVKEVDGMDDLMNDISGSSNNHHIKPLLQDYISVNAVKDLLNRIFSIVPQGVVKQDDRWVRNVMLVTKAPVKISSLYTCKQRSRDTAYVDIESIVSAEQSEGGTVYMKGKQNGHAIVSYSSGMPFLYETNRETVTTTSHQYEIISKEHFLLRGLPLITR